METIRIELKDISSGSQDKLIKIFKKKCDLYGVVKNYKNRKHHQKPSIVKKEKMEASQKRQKKLDNKVFRKSKRSKI